MMIFSVFSLFPFGAGRRQCLGESLARERLFLYSCVILQSFHLLPPDGEPLLSPDPRDFELGLILEPKPFSVKVMSRKTRTLLKMNTVESFDEGTDYVP